MGSDLFANFHLNTTATNHTRDRCKTLERIFRKLINKKEKLLLEAIVAFEKQANKLIKLLANEYELNLALDHPFGKLITRANNLWKGCINGVWDYQFHGDACKFENIENQQLLDVKINRKGNYGTISNFYLLKFIETTEELNYVLKEINTVEMISDIVDELERKEYIVDIDEPPFSTKILNKNNVLQQWL